MTKDVRLIPHKLEALATETSEIPQGVKMVGAPAMWEKDEKGQDVVVAVLDTGCQTDHPDLINQVIGGKNFTDDFSGSDLKFDDNNGHGTHVAGTIAALQNGTGVVGVAPKAKLLICKVLGGDGSGSYDWIIEGIKYATNWRGKNGERVRVISMSLGGPDDVPALHQAVKDAVAQGILFVCAAGNEGDSKEDTYEYAYPGGYNEVIEVGAVDLSGRLSSFSNNNTEVDCVAPGEDIVSTYPGSQYAKLSGTSMATPHVSGVLAVLIHKAEFEFGRKLTEAELYAQLIKHTQALGFKKSSEGNGLVKLDTLERTDKLVQFIAKEFCSY
ncbi:S8 family peptidase [Priestia megaterium]